jgi:uncharacterized protein (DUF3820 family)
MPNIQKPTSIQDEWMKKPPKSIKLGENIYDTIPKEGVQATGILTNMWEYLGKPSTPLSKSGEKMMKVLIAVWEDLYPLEVKAHFADRTEYQNNELTINQQVHQHTGRSLISYPEHIFKFMKKIFPNFKLGDRKNIMKLARKYPMFQMANQL